jgi:hypothetical protein
MRIVPLALSVCLCVLPARLSAQPAQPPANPAVSFEERAVVVSGLRPNGQVAWFGVAREVEDDWATLVRREEVAADTDGDGVVRLELDREVPLQSVWVAVDLTNGKVAIAAPDGFALRVAPLPVRGLGRGQGEGSPDYLEIDSTSVEAFVARPGVGVWGATAGDGGAGDDGPPRDRRVRIDLDRLSGRPGNAAAPQRFQPRDIVVLVDPDRLVVTVAELAEGPRS